MKKETILSLLIVLSILVPRSLANENATDDAERMRWWKDAKFGMFVHWGVYSQAGGEWNGETNHAEWLQFTAKIPLAEYADYAKSFNPTKFDAAKWVEIAKAGGAKYIVITSKHHDGFAMYDSASHDYNIVKASAYGRDPLKDLAAECEKAGIKFCVYYSLGRDWEDPDVPTGPSGSYDKSSKKRWRPGWRSNLIDYPNEDEKDFSKYFERKVKPQVRELLTGYGPIGVMWFDTPERIEAEQSAELLAMVRKLQPNCIVNQRVGNKLGDYGTPEQTIPPEASEEPWETCMTMNGKWSYNRADEKWKSPQTLIHNLIDIVSKGGNFLLNVGPTGEGIIPEPSVERLSEIGEWLSNNGEAIYGCGPTPFGSELGRYSETKKGSDGKSVFVRAMEWRATTKPGKLFIHILKRPEGNLMLPKLEQRVTKAYRLADPEQAKLGFEQTDDGVLLTLQGEMSDSIATVFCLELE